MILLINAFIIRYMFLTMRNSKYSKGYTKKCELNSIWHGRVVDRYDQNYTAEI